MTKKERDEVRKTAREYAKKRLAATELFQKKDKNDANSLKTSGRR